jgi:hypothetical protein
MRNTTNGETIKMNIKNPYIGLRAPLHINHHKRVSVRNNLSDWYIMWGSDLYTAAQDAAKVEESFYDFAQATMIFKHLFGGAF